MQVIPAILTADPLQMDRWLRQIRDNGRFSRVQIDFIDGEYAKNITFKPMETDVVPFLPLKFDAHLMVTENNITEWSKMAEKFGFDRVIAQMESISRPQDFSCLAMDFHSPVEAVAQYLSKLDLVLVMAVEPGFGGQEFDQSVLSKISELSRLRELRKHHYRLGVDGGVKEEHLARLAKMGVDEVVVGVKRVLQW